MVPVLRPAGHPRSLSATQTLSGSATMVLRPVSMVLPTASLVDTPTTKGHLASILIPVSIRCTRPNTLINSNPILKDR